MASLSNRIYNSDTELTKEYFARRKGDNPNDKVFRQGKWVDISEHNANAPIFRKSNKG